MKTYNVELKRTSYITLTVEAISEEEADTIAWEKIEREEPHLGDSDWMLESIEEVA
jgi:hypothetical protein